ncbi:class C sortase [Peptacetobacter hominis]|uniref:Class C sortase n=1 Tax=Peptacetobacter hominis TaxID=2743610 RepID=A0A544QSX7_9FIRM|nr:class C sortase [Peptacetobacter hominis]TQQ83146.1 class C sortase [Peptacetobacter hominis]
MKKRKKKNKKLQRFLDILTILALIIGLGVLLYPTISNYLYVKRSEKIISAYENNSIDMGENEKTKKYNNAIIYNQGLLNGVTISDPFSTNIETDEVYERQLDIDGNGMMGYIDIPEINLEAPIYHGTKEVVLQAGIGHLYGSSLPVGGESTHSVLTGHRGLPSKKLFTDLDQMDIGDRFYIHILGRTLAYQINQIVTVLPTQTEELSIVEGMDYCTLVTCTPYGINTHRLLIRGERIPYSEDDYKDDVKKGKSDIIFEIIILLIGIFIIFLLLFLYRRKRKKGEKVVEE